MNDNERINRFNDAVKEIYGKDFLPTGEPNYDRFDDYFFNTFTKKVGNKSITFQINENELNDPYGIRIDFASYEAASKFLKTNNWGN